MRARLWAMEGTGAVDIVPLRSRKHSVQVMERGGHTHARSERRFVWSFTAAWERRLWRFDQAGLRLAQQWPTLPPELWPRVPGRHMAGGGFKTGQAVTVVTPDGCLRTVMLPPEYEGGADEIELKLPASDLLVLSSGTRVAVLLAKLCTFATALEPALVLPVLLLMLGYDTPASIISLVMFMLATTSQIPKRFIWRFRPCVQPAPYPPTNQPPNQRIQTHRSYWAHPSSTVFASETAAGGRAALH